MGRDLNLQRTSTYLIGNRKFTVTFGNIVEVRADVLVSSDDNHLTMGGGVSAAICDAAGIQVILDTHKHIPAAMGDVVVTSAGNLKAKYIFHGVTINLDDMSGPDANCVSNIVSRSLTLAEALKLRHVAFPAIGTGLGGFPFEAAADAMARNIADFLSRRADKVEEVTLALYASARMSSSEANIFYERAAEIATQWTDSRRLLELADELEVILARRGSDPIRERLHELRVKVADAEATLSVVPDSQPSFRGGGPALGSVSDEVGRIANQSSALIDWEDLEARRTVLQLRLQSLRTQHNILIGNRNKLEEKRAKYGPHAVPLDVENGLEDVLNELGTKENEIRQVKSDLAGISPVI